MKNNCYRDIINESMQKQTSNPATKKEQPTGVDTSN